MYSASYRAGCIWRERYMEDVPIGLTVDFCSKIFTENGIPIGIWSFENAKQDATPVPQATLLSLLKSTFTPHLGWNLPASFLAAIIEPPGESRVA